MSDRVLDKKGSTGGDTVHVPTFVRTNSALVHAELQGAAGTTIKVRIEGRICDEAPWAQLGDVIIGSWMTAGAGEVKANASDSFAVQLAAAPQMRANVTTLTGAVASSLTNAVAAVGPFEPAHGDTTTITDAFGNSIVIYAVGIDRSPEADWSLYYFVQDASSNNGINVAALRAVADQAVADRKIFVQFTNGSSATRLNAAHLIPGTTGNSATVSSSSSVLLGGGTLSGGSGTDTYATVDIDSNW